MIDLRLEITGVPQIEAALNALGKMAMDSILEIWPHWKELIHDRIVANAGRKGASVFDKPAGTLIGKRTGHLVGAAKTGDWSFEFDKEHIKGTLNLAVPYGYIQEVGTVGADGLLPDIKPVKGQWLTQPLPPAMTKAGDIKSKAWKMKIPGTAEWKNSFIAKSKKGNLLIFYKEHGGIVPYWLLRKSTALKPTHWFSQSVFETVAALELLVAGQIEQAYELMYGKPTTI